MNIKIALLASLFLSTESFFASHKQNNPKTAKAKSTKKTKKEQDEDLLLEQAQALAQEALKTMSAKVVSTQKSRDDIKNINLFLKSVAKNDRETIENLLREKKVDINDENSEGLTALILATKIYDVKMVEFLLDNGASVDARNRQGVTALIIAGYHNKEIKIAELLLDRGANPNIRDKYNETALMIAVVQSNFEVAKLLLSNGADPNVQNSDSLTALMLASEGNNIKIAELLLANGAKPDMKNHDGDTALISASRMSHTEIVKHLLDAKADPNMQNKEDFTALMFASEKDNIEIPKLLLASGADPNLQNKYGVTALMIACYFKNIEIVEKLLTNRADPNMQNEDKFTALTYAFHEGNAEIVKLLLNNKADFNLLFTSDFGDLFNPFQNLTLEEKDQIVELLWQNGQALSFSQAIFRQLSNEENSEFEDLKEMEKNELQKILKLELSRKLLQQGAKRPKTKEKSKPLKLTTVQKDVDRLKHEAEEISLQKRVQDFLEKINSSLLTSSQVEELSELLKEFSLPMPLEVASMRNKKQTLFGKYDSFVNADHIINTKLSTAKVPNKDQYEVAFAGGHFDASIQNLIKYGLITLISESKIPGNATQYNLVNNMNNKHFVKTTFPEKLTIQEVLKSISSSKIIDESQTKDLTKRETIVVKSKHDNMFIKNVLKELPNHGSMLVSSYPIGENE